MSLIFSQLAFDIPPFDPHTIMNVPLPSIVMPHQANIEQSSTWLMPT
jgi:hypothetical protein